MTKQGKQSTEAGKRQLAGDTGSEATSDEVWTSPVACSSARWGSRSSIVAGLCLIFAVSSSCNMEGSVEQSAAEASESPIPISASADTLSETGFGKLRLEPGLAISLEDVVGAFAEHDVVDGVGSQDGPDFRLITIREDDARFAYIQMETSESNVISVFSVESAGVADTYGNSVGRTFLEIKENRPDIQFATEHAHTYAFVPGSHIGYELQMRGYSGPDLQEYSEAQIASWTLGRLIWFNRTINGN